MAVVLQLAVSPAAREQFNELDAQVGKSMSAAGGPPAGLMSHVAYPEGDGFVVAEVWRTEAEGQAYVNEVLRPLVSEAGLSVGEMTTRAAWSFARPRHSASRGQRRFGVAGIWTRDAGWHPAGPHPLGCWPQGPAAVAR